MNEYKEKIKEIIKEHDKLNNLHDELLFSVFADENDDLVYYLYVKDFFINNNKRTKHLVNQHAFLYLSQHSADNYRKQVFYYLRNKKINKILNGK